MKKLLNLSLKDNIYNLEINNCIDYNIGQVLGYFDKNYTNLYYSYRTLIVNYSSVKNYNEYIFDKMYIEREAIEITNLIDDIISIINDEHLVCVEVPNSILFYSPMYKEKNIVSINHSFIIEGYDSEREVFFIRDSSVNKELIAQFSNATILSRIQITFSMLQSIFKDLSLDYDVNKLVYYFSNKMSYNNAYLSFINDVVYLKFKNDILIYELNKTVDREYYHTYYLSEQFRRDYLLSFKQFFDFIFLSFKQQITADIYNNREETIDFLYKSAYRNSCINKELINKYCNLIRDDNEKLFRLFYASLLNNSFEYTRIKRFEIEADSVLEDYNYYFNTNNLIYDYKTDDYNRFWISDNNIEQHFLKVKSNEEFDKIIIEHPANVKFICKEYKIVSKKKVLLEVKNNCNTSNTIYLNSPISQFEIFFTKNNENYDNSVRLKHIYLYKKSKKIEYIYDDSYNNSNIYELYKTYSYLYNNYSFDNILKILMWVFTHLISNNKYNYCGKLDAISILNASKERHLNFNCICFSEVFSKLLLAGGYKSRLLFLLPDNPLEDGNHVMVEAYVMEYQKWVVFEPTGAMFFLKENGVPLSMIELISYLNNEEQIKIKYCKKFDDFRLNSTFSFNDSNYFKYIKDIAKYIVISKYQTYNDDLNAKQLYAFPTRMNESRKTIKFKYGVSGKAIVVKDSELLWG